MAGRLTVFAVLAVLGFVGGILANYVYSEILVFFPNWMKLLTTQYFLSGLVGMVLTLLIVVVWASLSPEK